MTVGAYAACGHLIAHEGRSGMRQRESGSACEETCDGHRYLLRVWRPPETSMQRTRGGGLTCEA